MNNLDEYLDSANKVKFFEMLKDIFKEKRRVYVFYGAGNNGKTTLLLNDLVKFMEQFNVPVRVVHTKDIYPSDKFTCPPPFEKATNVGSISIIESNTTPQFPYDVKIDFKHFF